MAKPAADSARRTCPLAVNVATRPPVRVCSATFCSVSNCHISGFRSGAKPSRYQALACHCSSDSRPIAASPWNTLKRIRPLANIRVCHPVRSGSLLCASAAASGNFADRTAASRAQSAGVSGWASKDTKCSRACEWRKTQSAVTRKLRPVPNPSSPKRIQD